MSVEPGQHQRIRIQNYRATANEAQPGAAPFQMFGPSWSNRLWLMRRLTRTPDGWQRFDDLARLVVLLGLAVAIVAFIAAGVVHDA